MNNKLQHINHESPHSAKATQGERDTGRESRKVAGSAIILTVVLTSILAIIGMMFIMIARVDRMATSNISENKELNYAVESVVTKISQELVSDVPGMPKGIDYYDYPDVNNAWLANIEPYLYDNNSTPTDINDDKYNWRQISDVTGYIRLRYDDPYNNYTDDWGKGPASSGYLQTDIPVDAAGYDVNGTVLPYYRYGREVISEYPEIALDGDGELYEQWADADGDGIADSKWIELENITSDKGKPIYAAIRIIDNGGMVNVNTAYKFDPVSSNAARIDGSSQLQINLDGLRKGTTDKIEDVNKARDPNNKSYSKYQDEVIWRIEDPCRDYLPFDISDELELKYRYCIDSNFVCRLERNSPSPPVLPETMRRDKRKTANSGDLYNTKSLWGLGDWQIRVTNPADPCADRRHVLTTYNMDRIITPDCNKMAGINSDSNTLIYDAIKDALGSTYPNIDAVAAQLTVNLIDYVDGPTSGLIPDPGNNVSIYRNPDNSVYYGFEQPCVYISELTRRFKLRTGGGGSLPVPGNFIDRSYAIELYKPYSGDDPPAAGQWRLDISSYGAVPITWSGTKLFHVVHFCDSNIPLSIDTSGASVQSINNNANDQIFRPNSIIELQRLVGSDWLTVDAVTVPSFDPPGVWNKFDDKAQSVQRDTNLQKCIRRLWDPSTTTLVDTELGKKNTHYVTGDPIYIQAHPANSDFNNVGEIGLLFTKPAYYEASLPTIPSSGVIGYSSDVNTEAKVRLNLAGLNNEPNLFKYLTVFDPNSDGINNDGDRRMVGTVLTEIIDGDDLVATPEWKVPGRININTAPWYVLAQLPWVSQRKSGYNNTALAHAIVACRDKTKIPCGEPNDYGVRPGVAGFETIGRLCDVNLGADLNYHIDYYATSSSVGDLLGFPDLTTLTPTTGDEAPDDFEERDVIFARISNLVTVRSDVFTAYILVRVGTDGPQKRVVAILDRSDVYLNPKYDPLHPVPGVVQYFGKVKIRALHSVPDPR